MKKERKWSKLDNAAKIFPPTSNNKDTKVFRFSVELKENVDPGALQRALNLTLKRFPFFRSVLKKGLFWYYFEETRLIPEVKEEYKPPCSRLYDANDKGLLFEVTYYKKRINLEIFHALSDGTGAIQFFRVLIVNYINCRFRDRGHNLVLDDYDASEYQMTLDSFSKYFSDVKVKRIKAPAAYRYKGRRYPDYNMGIVECIISTNRVKELAKEQGLTITEYLVVLLIESIGENMSNQDKQKVVSVSIPVNLRNYFPSKTSRNFFGVVNLTYDFLKQGEGRESITERVKDFFRNNLNKKNLQDIINLFASLENKLPAKLVPLFLKIPILKMANRISSNAVTAAFSNVGQIKLPAEAEEYIDRFSVFASTDKLQVTMCSFGDDMVISFTSPFTDTNLECSFLDKLKELDMKVDINTNIGDLKTK